MAWKKITDVKGLKLMDFGDSRCIGVKLFCSDEKQELEALEFRGRLAKCGYRHTTDMLLRYGGKSI